MSVSTDSDYDEFKGNPFGYDSIQRAAEMAGPNQGSVNEKIVDAYKLDNLFIVELGSVQFILIIIYFILSLSAICLGIVALSEWVSGSSYKGSKTEENGFEYASYVVSGLSLILGIIIFVLVCYYYFNRRSRLDQKLLTKKASQLQAAILTIRYKRQLDQLLPQHSKNLQEALDSGVIESVQKNLAINGGSGQLVAQQQLEAAQAALSDAQNKERAAKYRGRNAEVEAATLSTKTAQDAVDKAKRRLGERKGEALDSPISLSRASRRKSPSSLKKKKASPSSLKKKKPSPSSLKKKKASPSSLKKKKKSTSSRRK